MTDFPRGGDIQACRRWLDKEGFAEKFIGWKADAILGKDDAFIKSKFEDAPEEQNKAEMLCGLLNTARESPQQVRVGYKRKRRSEIQVKLRIQNKSLKTTVFESIVANSEHPGTLFLNRTTAKKLGLKKIEGSKCLIALEDGSYEEEWSYHPEVHIKVVDPKIMKIGECCPIYGGPNYMRAATTKGENLLGLTGLEILNLDIDNKANKLVVTLPNKKRSNKGDVYKRVKSVKRWGLYRKN